MTKRLIIYSIFFILVVYTGYLYSLRLDLVPWGRAERDGLFFLIFYFSIFPTLVIVSFIKRHIYNTYNTFLRNSFFVYSALIAIPSIDFYSHQLSLAFGFFISCIIVVMLIYELLFLGSLVPPLSRN